MNMPYPICFLLKQFRTWGPRSTVSFEYRGVTWREHGRAPDADLNVRWWSPGPLPPWYPWQPLPIWRHHA